MLCACARALMFAIIIIMNAIQFPGDVYSTLMCACMCTGGGGGEQDAYHYYSNYTMALLVILCSVVKLNNQ